jgi:hypothetical protein
MLSRLKKYAGLPDPNFPRPPMEAGEEIIAEDRAGFKLGLFGGRGGPLILTSRRLIWYEDSKIWPLKGISGDMDLRNIRSVSTNGLVGFFLGGTNLKVRVRNGRTRLFVTSRAPSKIWVEALQETIAKARETQS